MLVIIPACCWSIINGPFPYTSIKVPLIHTAFETGASTASGVKAGLETRGDTETTVAAWVGRRGDLRHRHSVSFRRRGTERRYYLFLLRQRSLHEHGDPAEFGDPLGHLDHDHPRPTIPRASPRKNMMEIMAAHRIPYAATCSVAFSGRHDEQSPEGKVDSRDEFIHIYSPCPTGWKAPSSLAVKIARSPCTPRFSLFTSWRTGTALPHQHRPQESAGGRIPPPPGPLLPLDGR